MIRIIVKCLGKSELKEYRWNFHPAFLHFTDYKNTLINGKPLKWWHILKNGDTIEVIKSPKDFVTIGLIFTALLVTHPILTVLGTLAVIGIIGATIAGATGAFNQSTSGSTTAKEYSSTTQAELRGASNDISGSIIPVLFGKTQQTPNYGQTPYRLVGDGSSTNKYHCYFVSNYNNVVYSDYKLGETNINDYSAEYIDIDTSSGGSFIGWDNCRAVDVNEELSYDSEGIVNQSNNYNYNQSASDVEVYCIPIIEFQNVDISNFATKTFTLKLYCLNGASPVTLTQNLTINSGDLTLVGGTTYRYTTSIHFVNTVTHLTSSEIYPTSYTRGNSTETTNELISTYISERIIIGAFDNTRTFNQGINYYLGTVSEVLLTSPDNTTEIDVILSFPSGLYTAENDGSRSNRTTKIEIQYK